MQKGKKKNKKKKQKKKKNKQTNKNKKHDGREYEWVCDLSRCTPRQREFHSKPFYCDLSNNGALLYSSATYVAVPYNVTNRKLIIASIWRRELNGSQLAKMKNSIPDMSLPWNFIGMKAVWS